ncbi:MAG: oxygen-independent coproporphyrinogen-3 oxidase [Planctomycetota bacterium]|jgi:oxygen-independent coproporphyrinogen-3 oxidase
MHTENDQKALPGTPLYVHVPFCAAKCHYCDFYSFAAETSDSSGFVNLLLKEAELRAPLNPQTVFIGGGTPTWLSHDELIALFNGLDRVTNFRSSAVEVTVECNPESLDKQKAELLLELGANRLSIGFQSLRPEILELFGRVHQVDQSFAAYRAAREAGVPAISIDMIYAAPGEKIETWETDLARVIELGPDHISAYNLTFEEGTAFEQWRKSGKLEPQEEETELRFFWRTREIMETAGYGAYEISNFSLIDQQCSHNVNYWHNGAYVGIGPSAVSKVGPRRTGNPRTYENWGRRIGKGSPPLFDWEESLPPLEALGETWWLGLRLRTGLDPAHARSVASFSNSHDPCVEEAERLREQGLLRFTGSHYQLTDQGLPLADAVAKQFLVPGSG